MEKLIKIFRRFVGTFREQYRRAHNNNAEKSELFEGDHLVPAFVEMFLFIKTLNPDKMKQDLNKSMDVCNLFNEKEGDRFDEMKTQGTELTNFLPVVVKDLVELESAFPKSFHTKDVNL